MLWAMVGTMAAFWALFAALYVAFALLRRRNRARKRGWTAATGNTPGAFSRLHDPAKPPPNINPKTGAPF